jgi:hypothetical protein
MASSASSYTLVTENCEGGDTYFTLVPDVLLESIDAKVLRKYGGCCPDGWPRKLKNILGPIIGVDEDSSDDESGDESSNESSDDEAEPKPNLEGVVRFKDHEGGGFCVMPAGCVISRVFVVNYE